MKGLFITGTGTGVGKTMVTATLVRALRQAGRNAVALKPFASGIDYETPWRDNDPLVLAAAASYVEPPEVVSPIQLKLPLSPYDAARAANCALDTDTVLSLLNSTASRYDIALVEGVGGAYVPITDTCLVADFAASLGLPALVVARTDLGTINHTLLTVDALRRHGVHVAGIVYSQQAPGTPTLDQQVGPTTACQFARTACFGTVEYNSHFIDAMCVDEAVDGLNIQDAAIQTLVKELLEN